MSYVALYRKFRPQVFSDVKGQEHIVTTLQNQIKANRIGHAYLFTGTRGTGKTTVAKIFARAVNCENPSDDGSPCGECSICQAITAGNSMNVIEIDAASNNGVDNIREIIEEVAYPPTEGKYKVYIIDEVHMLSTGAFNALLKTLEEPPEYVIFILATTEVQKIPITILSRVQRYDFRRISIDTIAARLQDLMNQEGVEVEERAIRYIAKAADGSMRDALSLLDQCIAFYLGQTLTYDNVLSVLGAVDTEIFSRLLRSIIDKNVTKTIQIVEEIILEGRELRQFVIDFTWYIRNLLLVKSVDNMEDVLDMSTENLALLREEANMVDDVVLMRYIRILSDLSNDLRYASQKRVLVEIAMIKLCKPEMEEDYGSLIDRVSTLEERMEAGIPVVMAPSQESGMGVSQGPSMTAKAGPVKQALPEAIPEEVEQAVRRFHELTAGTGGLMVSILNQAFVTLDENCNILLVYDRANPDHHTAIGVLERPNQIQELEDIVSEGIGKHVNLRLKVNESEYAREQLFTDPIAQFGVVKNLDIVVEDF